MSADTDPGAKPAPATAETVPGRSRAGSGSTRPAARRSIDLSRTVAAAAELLEQGDLAHAGVATDARDLLIDEIEPDPLQPRKHFGVADLRALSEDIARRGVLQPVLVRPPLEPGGKFRLVAGERRWRAADLAGKVRIPARIRELSDEDVRAAQLAENVLRAGLSDIEKGRALRGLYELRKAQNPKSTWEDIASEVGMGRARIHDLFHLASLPESIAALIASGRLSGSHGIALQRAQETLSEEQLVAFARRAARAENRRGGGFGLSVARLREEILAIITAASGTDGADGAANASTLSIQIDKARGFRENGAEYATDSQSKSSEFQPFVRRTLSALAKNQLSSEERQMLLTALQQSSNAPTTNENQAEADESKPE